MQSRSMLPAVFVVVLTILHTPCLSAFAPALALGKSLGAPRVHTSARSWRTSAAHSLRSIVKTDGSEPAKRDASDVAVNTALSVLGAFALSRLLAVGLAKLAEAKREPVKFPEEAWDAKLASGELSKEAYSILRNAATERPFSSRFNGEARQGVFSCAMCDTGLFDMETKFDSGTGWPSFFEGLPGVEVEEGNKVDNIANMRSEVHCEKCGGHLGHVFGDGRVWGVPTGKRFCINGAAMTFAPSAVSEEASATG